MLTSKLLQSSSEGVSRGQTANNGKLLAMPPQQALSHPKPNQEWELKERPPDNGSVYPSPPPDSNHPTTTESLRQLTYSFEVDV